MVIPVDPFVVANKDCDNNCDKHCYKNSVPLVEKWANKDLTWQGLNLKQEDRIAKANKILDDLGFTMGKSRVRKMKDGKDLSLSIR